MEDELKELFAQLEYRQLNYGICDAKLDRIPQQKEVLEVMMERLKVPEKDRVQYMLYFWGNGAGKTFLGAYITVCLLLGHETKKYGLPFLWVKKEVWIGTESGSNVQSVIEPYLLWEGSSTRIPPEEIEGLPHKDNKILKGFSMKNGARVYVKTYEQGFEKFQGWNPDWIWLDEEPTDAMIWTELQVRVRRPDCEMLVTMTPLKGLTRIHDFFMKSTDEELKAKTRVWRVSSMDNPFTSKLWAKGLTPEEYRLRVLGSFESPTGLVYSHFDVSTNVVPHIDPEDLPNPKFYKAIDFGTSHPTAVVFVAKDDEWNVYVFDEYKRSNALITDIAKAVKDKSKHYEFEWFVRDSASAREWLELKNIGLTTTKVNKKVKGDNEMSNRRAGIMLVNQLFYNNKLFISDRCVNLIQELQTHYYKDGNKDGEVIKENDDLLDALRYCIFTIAKEKKEKSPLEKKYERRYGETLSWIKIVCG